jgi:hypothetical protein
METNELDNNVMMMSSTAKNSDGKQEIVGDVVGGWRHTPREK